jgi:hypothetical protein
MTDTPYTQAIIPALAVVLFIGLGIVGNPGLGVVTDAVGSGDDPGPAGGDSTATATADRAASSGGRSAEQERTEAVITANEDRQTPEDYGQQMVDVYSEGDTDGSRVGSDRDMSLLSPNSSLAMVLRGPFYLLNNTNSSLARTLQATDDTVTDVGDAAADGEVPTDEVANGTDEVTDIVDDTVDNTTDGVDQTTDDTGEVVDDTTDDVTDTVDNTTDGATDSTTDAVDETVDDTTDAVETATGDTTDAVDTATGDTTDAVTGDEEPTPTEDGGVL